MDFGKLFIFLGKVPLRQIAIQKDKITLGREAEIRLDAKLIEQARVEANVPADLEILSRSHAEIASTADGATITDTSTNGTLLNGKRLTRGVAVTLQHADTIVIGPFVIRFWRPELAQPPAPSALAAKQLAQADPGALIDVARARTLAALPMLGTESSYWRLLPPFYRDTDAEGVLNALLLVCEIMLDPIDQLIRQIDAYVDPQTAPKDMLRYLAYWVDLPPDTGSATRRQLIMRAAELNTWRGTRRGLREYIRIFTTIEPIIVEPGQVSGKLPETLEHIADEVHTQADGAHAHRHHSRRSLTQDLRYVLEDVKHASTSGMPDKKFLLELQQLIEGSVEDHSFHVIALLPPGRPVAEWQPMIQRIIQAEKPAHVPHKLTVLALA